MSAPRPATTAAAWALLLALSALGVAGLLAERARQARTPPDEALAAAAAHVRARFEEGDAVLVRPGWDERAWAPLQGAGPGADAWPFPALMRGDALDPVDLLRSRRAWVIGAFGRAPDLAPLAPEDARLVADEAVAPHVRVALWELADLAPRARLTDDLARLRVARVAPDGRVRACPFDPKGEGEGPGGRFRCGLQGWLDPHLETRDVFHRDVTWLYAHPGPGADTLEVTWPEVPRGRALVVRAGFTQMAVRHDVGAPVEVGIEVDGVERDAFSLAPHVYALERRLLDLPPGEAPVRVVVRVRSDDIGWRELMLQADVIDRVPASVATWATARRP